MRLSRRTRANPKQLALSWFPSGSSHLPVIIFQHRLPSNQHTLLHILTNDGCRSPKIIIKKKQSMQQQHHTSHRVVSTHLYVMGCHRYRIMEKWYPTGRVCVTVCGEQARVFRSVAVTVRSRNLSGYAERVVGRGRDVGRQLLTSACKKANS